MPSISRSSLTLLRLLPVLHRFSVLLTALVATVLREDTSDENTTISHMETFSLESEKSAKPSEFDSEGSRRGLSIGDNCTGNGALREIGSVSLS